MAAQSGKTQKTINIIQNKIQNYIDGFWDKPKVFTIWFSSNSKAINSQTFDRLKKTNANCIQWDTDNPYEIGMDRLVDLDMDSDFVSKKALTKIKQDGITQKQVGLVIDGAPLIGSNDEKWPVMVNGERVGMVTSAIHSPRLEQNIALALVAIGHADLGQAAQIEMGSERRSAMIVEKPFFDPKKEITAKS